MANRLSPDTRKPTAAPGRMACAMASPTRLMRRSIRNTPIGPAPSANASTPASARRMNSNSANGAIRNSYIDGNPVQSGRGFGASTHSAACSSNASHMRRAASRFSAVSTVAVRPQATGSRASSSVSGKCARTKSISCMAVSTVRSSPCQRCTRSNRSAEVLASTALNGSSRTMTRASCSSRRANSMRCIWPPDSVPIARFSKPVSPTAAIACSSGRAPCAVDAAEQPGCGATVPSPPCRRR